VRGHSEAQEVKLGLKYPGEWKFGTTESADAVPADAVDEFFALTVQIASSADSPKSVLELFKSTFASFHGRSYSSSSSYEWAESDLSSLMHECAERSPTFIDAYWTSISKMEQTGVPAPGVEYLNSILTKYGIPYVIDPPKLLRAQGDAILLKVAEQAYNSASPRTSLERYLLVSELGHGGFGRVYHAKRTTSVEPSILRSRYLIRVLSFRIVRRQKHGSAGRLKRFKDSSTVRSSHMSMLDSTARDDLTL